MLPAFCSVYYSANTSRCFLSSVCTWSVCCSYLLARGLSVVKHSLPIPSRFTLSLIDVTGSAFGSPITEDGAAIVSFGSTISVSGVVITLGYPGARFISLFIDLHSKTIMDESGPTPRKRTCATSFSVKWKRLPAYRRHLQ